MISIESFTGYPYDGKVRLVKTLSDTAGFYVCDNDPIYATEIQGGDNCRKEVETACLKLLLDAKLRPVDAIEEGVANNDERHFDIIRLTNWTNDREFTAFIELCEMHSNKANELTFKDFFYSLNDLFQPNKEQSRLNAYGLYCELALIDLLARGLNQSIDITAYWQQDGPNSKYDFTFPYGNVEVKNANKDLEALIKHDQLFNKDNNYLVAVCTERNPSGEALADLAERLLNHDRCFTTLQSRLELNRRLLQVNEKDLSRKMSVRSIRGFKADLINPFKELSERVTHLSYRLSLVGLDYENAIKLIEGMLFNRPRA